MPYMAWCQDRADSAPARQRMLGAHLAYVEKHLDSILVAGPLKNRQGEMAGSAYIYDTEHEEAARRLLEQDPYYHAGIWASTELLYFQTAAGTWYGGLSWK